MESVPDFARRIKAKYPDYAEVPDAELVSRILDKHPEYKSVVDVGTPDNGGQAGGMGDVKMAESTAGAPPVNEPLNPIFPSAEAEYNARMTRPSGSAWQSVKDAGAVGLAAAGDIGSLLQRGAAAALTDQTMNTPGAHALKTQTDAAVAGAQADLEANPELQNYIPPGGFGGVPMMMPTPAMAPALTDMGGRLIDDPINYGGVLAKTLSYIPKMVGAAGAGAAKLNQGAGRLAQELSGVPEEALRAYGNPVERAKILANAGKEAEIGNDLLHQIDAPDKFLPEKQAVDAALDKMKPISIQSAVDALEKGKGASVAGRLSPEKAAANASIDRYIEFLRGGDAPADLIPAKEYRRLRQDLDAPIKFDEEGGAIKNAALKAGRTTMKEELLKAAEASGDPGYAKAMAAWSDKLDKLERIKKVLGKTGETRDRRVEGFIDNLFGPKNKYKRQLMEDLDAVFQSDITERAKAAQNAQALGPNGVASWLPRQFNGRSLVGLAGTSAAGTVGTALGVPSAGPLALAGAVATASPKIAARITLPALTKLEQGLKAAGIALTPKAAHALEAMKRPIGEAQRARLATILAAELEAQMPTNAIPFRKQVAEEDEPIDYITRR